MHRTCHGRRVVPAERGALVSIAGRPPAPPRRSRSRPRRRRPTLPIPSEAPLSECFRARRSRSLRVGLPRHRRDVVPVAASGRWREATPSRTSSARAEKSVAGTIGRRGDAWSGEQIPYSFRPPPQPTYVADSRFTGPRGRLRRGSESQTTSIRRRPTAEGVRPSRRRFQYRPLL